MASSKTYRKLTTRVKYGATWIMSLIYKVNSVNSLHIHVFWARTDLTYQKSEVNIWGKLMSNTWIHVSIQYEGCIQSYIRPQKKNVGFRFPDPTLAFGRRNPDPKLLGKLKKKFKKKVKTDLPYLSFYKKK